jgi:hypothetical protein
LSTVQRCDQIVVLRGEAGLFACSSRDEIDRLYAEACREGRPTRAPIDAGDPVGYVARIADPDGTWGCRRAQRWNQALPTV